VETLKFERHARTGLTHFDRVRDATREHAQQIEELKKQHDLNLARLMHAAEMKKQPELVLRYAPIETKTMDAKVNSLAAVAELDADVKPEDDFRQMTR